MSHPESGRNTATDTKFADYPILVCKSCCEISGAIKELNTQGTECQGPDYVWFLFDQFVTNAKKFILNQNFDVFDVQIWHLGVIAKEASLRKFTK